VKETIATEQAPKAIGPYAQAIRHNGLVYTSGQIALDPATGQLVEGGIAEQTARVIENLKAVLEAAGAGLASVLKTTVFLKEMGEFAAMNEVYGRFLGTPPPARTTIAVAALPKGGRVEIELVAVGRAR